MALFQVAAAGSGILSPIWPDLTLTYTYDGLGLLFACPSHNFLYVFNGDSTDDGSGPPNGIGGTCPGRSLQYAPGLFTGWVPQFGGKPLLGLNGPKLWNLRSYPRGLGFDFVQDLTPTQKSEYPFPATYTGGNSNYSRDPNYDTNNTGDGRRHVTWPPLRALLYSNDGALQASAWLASQQWCLTQLARPLCHIGAALDQSGKGVTVPFTPFKNVVEYSAGFGLNWLTGSDGKLIPQAWQCEGSKRLCPDLDGIVRNWNAGDPAHNDVVPQFYLACMDHPLGAVLIWLLYSWYVQGTPPLTTNSFGMYAYPWGQERSVHWSGVLIYLYAYLLGFQWADPNLIRDWCGGLKPSHNNAGAGWRPRDALRWWLDAYAGPDYGGPNAPVSARYDKTGANSDKQYGTHVPLQGAGKTFVFNGKSYGRQVASTRGFHRNMTLWSIPEAIRAHDYILGIDPTEFLLDPARIQTLRTFSRQHAQLTVDAGLINF